MSKKLLTILKPHQYEVEQFKSLRTKLLFPASGKRPRSIAVTSPAIGEGKSFVASNLAISIAQNVDQRQTLLIDCDIHLPTVHKLFGFDDAPGLTEYLLHDDVSLSSLLLRPPEVGNLTILPGGTPPPNASELLSSKKMSELLSEVQDRYEDRYVLVDLPSPKIVAETSLIARQMDGVIVVAQYGRTSKEHIRELLNMLGKENVLGVVLNRFDTNMSSYTYRMYRKYVRRKQ